MSYLATPHPDTRTAYEIGRGGMTLEQIAQLLGVTRERVRQIEATALRKLRKKGLTKQMLSLAKSLEASRGSGDCRIMHSGRRPGLGN